MRIERRRDPSETHALDPSTSRARPEPVAERTDALAEVARAEAISADSPIAALYAGPKAIGHKDGEDVVAPPRALVEAEDLVTHVEAHLDTAGGRAMAAALEADAPRFGVPPGGFSGQTNLYGGSDLPVAWWTLRGALGDPAGRSEPSERAAARMADDLGRATMVTDDPALLLAVTMREHPSAWTAGRGEDRVETFNEGGLDYLGDHLGAILARVPREARTGSWEVGPAIESGETGEMVHPAVIPAADQLVAYAAELERAEDTFEALVTEVYGADAERALASLSTDERRAWIQFTFGRPGRTHAADLEISDRAFSANAALELLHGEGNTDLGAILDDPRFAANASVRRARTTALEAHWLEEHLLD